mgnify:FL=1
MKFSYSVIGDNTQENREWLEKVGYKVNHSSDDRFLRTYEDGSTKISHFKNWIYEDKQPINCIGNSPLFKAISAMRGDSNFGQWFVDPCGYWHFNPIIMDGMRKATLTELQERFKL